MTTDVPYVYYARIGDEIKIGTSKRIATRMVVLHAEEVLAVEPGSYELERQRHDQFRGDLVRAREYFRPSQSLLDHIAALGEVHPLPDLRTTLEKPRRSPVSSRSSRFDHMTVDEMFDELRRLTTAQPRLAAGDAWYVLTLRSLGESFERMQRIAGVSAGSGHRMTKRYRIADDDEYAVVDTRTNETFRFTRDELLGETQYQAQTNGEEQG